MELAVTLISTQIMVASQYKMVHELSVDIKNHLLTHEEHMLIQLQGL